MNFKGKFVIITGGTGGIGSSLSQRFCKEGANILLTGTKKIKVENFFNEKYKNNIQYQQVDFSDEISTSKFIHLLESLDRIDVLINNAGVNKIDSIHDVANEDWDWINSVNLKAPFLLSKTVSKKMKSQRYGKIINIASIFGVVSKKKRAVYSSTKWGLIGLTKATALDLASFNIQVNAVSPGFVDTELTARILGQKKIKELISFIPQGRLATSDEISEVVLFLSSDLNTYITGQNIIVDGGYTIA